MNWTDEFLVTHKRGHSQEATSRQCSSRNPLQFGCDNLVVHNCRVGPMPRTPIAIPNGVGHCGESPMHLLTRLKRRRSVSRSPRKRVREAH